jgi:hypothetical protein
VWGIEWLVVQAEGTRRVPAFDFLAQQPTNVCTTLLAIVDAVRHGGPDKWRDTHTHAPLHGELDHLHEARDKHGQTLYRLFLCWQREHHRVVVLDGRTKQKNTTLSDADYEAIGQLSEAADADPPSFAVADDFARAVLE